MSLVTVMGDAATTSTLALAAGWPDEVLVLEADPRGGSMAAWLDLPATPTVSTAVTRAAEGGWPVIEAVVHRASAGPMVITAPVRTIEAARAISEAERHVFPILAALDRPTVLADAGRCDPVAGRYEVPAVAHLSDLVLVVHRQSRQSPRAAAVRIERLADLVETISAATASVPLVLAVIGDAPFEPAEVARFVGGEQRVSGLVELADDPLSAAVIAGRTGVSARRLARLPLMRTARRAAMAVERRATAVRQSTLEPVAADEEVRP